MADKVCIVQLESARDFVINYDTLQYRSASLTQLRKHIYEAIEQLPPKAKDAIMARLIEGLSPTEAAQKAGCSIQAFYNRFDAGLKAPAAMRETGRLNVDETIKYQKKLKKLTPLRSCYTEGYVIGAKNYSFLTFNSRDFWQLLMEAQFWRSPTLNNSNRYRHYFR